MSNINEKLVLIQTALNVPKTEKNTFGKYNYRTAEGILSAVKPLLAEHKCYLTLNDEIVMMGNRFYVKTTATLTDSENNTVSSTAFAREEESKKGMDGSQVTGASSSYARKYALNGLFAIDDGKDADSLNTHADYTAPQPPPMPQHQPLPSMDNETFKRALSNIKTGGLDRNGILINKHYVISRFNLTNDQLAEIHAIGEVA